MPHRSNRISSKIQSFGTKFCRGKKDLSVKPCFCENNSEQVTIYVGHGVNLAPYFQGVEILKNHKRGGVKIFCKNGGIGGSPYKRFSMEGGVNNAFH